MPLAIRLADGPSEERDRFYQRGLTLFVGSALVAALAVTASARDVVRVVAPPEYAMAYAAVPWLAGAQTLQGSAMFTNLGMVVSKKTAGNSVAAWTGSATNIGICLLLIPRYGVNGAAVGFFVSSLIFTASLWWFSKRVGVACLEVTPLVAFLGVYVVCCAALLGLDRLGNATSTFGVVARYGLCVVAGAWIAARTRALLRKT